MAVAAVFDLHTLLEHKSCFHRYSPAGWLVMLALTRLSLTFSSPTLTRAVARAPFTHTCASHPHTCPYNFVTPLSPFLEHRSLTALQPPQAVGRPAWWWWQGAACVCGLLGVCKMRLHPGKCETVWAVQGQAECRFGAAQGVVTHGRIQCPLSPDWTGPDVFNCPPRSL